MLYLQANKDVTLDFHDSGQDDVLFEQGDMQTHTFKDFPHSAEDDEEEGDKSEVGTNNLVINFIVHALLN